MKKERCEQLKTDMEIKESARRKSNITTFAFVMCQLYITILGLIYVIANAESIVPLLIAVLLTIVMIFIMRHILLPMAFEEFEKAKRSETYVEKHLSTKQYIEVQPIKEKSDIELVAYANFYARPKDDVVIIIMKLKDKKEYYEYKRILKDCFYDCYRIKEEYD